MTPSCPRSVRATLSLLGLALSLSGCRRDVGVPPPSTFAVVDAFPSAAPRETLLLVATGGTQPYAYAFAAGGPGSGLGATVDASGHYQAGAWGPALDVVEVRDAAGAMREVRVSVGPPLQVTPTQAFVAPGGSVGFVASGGKQPYALEFTGAGAHHGTTAGTTFTVEAGGGCAGLVSDPATVTLRLVDGTGTASPTLSVEIGRGLDLFPAAGVGAVAPHETIAFLASGGQPPYQFSMAANPSAGPGVNPGRGTYTAGATGQVTDRVQVTDANGQVACFAVAVGPELGFTFSNTRARPGQPMKVLASGGRPPYRFLFADKGNRSRATLDAVNGDYVPGYNTGATDLITVADATGAPALPARAIQVGPVQVDAYYPDQGCLVGDVDGNGVLDAVAINSQRIATTVELRPGKAPRLATTTVGAVLSAAALGDVDGDGRMDLVTVSPLDLTLEVELGQGDGSFVVGGLRAPGIVARRVAVARGSRRIFSLGSATGCGAGLAWVEYDATKALLGTPGCVSIAGSLGSFSSLVAGDFDGDTLDDAAYTRTTTPQAVYFRLAREGFAVEHAVALPGTWRYEAYAASSSPALEVRRDGATSSDVVLVVYDGPRATTGTRTGLATLRGGAAGLTLQQVDRVDFGGLYNILGMTALGLGAGATPRLAVSNGADGQVLIYDFPVTPAPLALSAWQVAPRDYRVAGLCGGDLDGDGLDDMVMTPREYGTLSDVLLGELDGGWDRRPRFHSIGNGLIGDVDGDGVADFISPLPGLGLEVLLPAGGEIALGPATPTDGVLFDARAADWDGDGVPDLMARLGATGFSLLHGLGAGRFGPQVPVTVTSPAGVPYDPIAVYFAVARLGGASPGPDLFTYVRAGSQLYYAAVVFSDPTHGTFGVSDLPFGAYPYFTGVADLDGDGIDDLVVVGVGGAIRVALVKPGTPGSTWPFLPSVEVQPAPTTYFPSMAGVIDVPGAVPRRQRAVVLGLDAVLLVEAPAGVPLTTPSPISLGIDVIEVAPVGVADVTGDGWPDLVLIGYLTTTAIDPVSFRYLGGDLLVLRGTATGGFEATPDPSLTLHLGGLLGGSTLPSPGGGPADLLISGGSSSVILHNDGAGHFR